MSIPVQIYAEHPPGPKGVYASIRSFVVMGQTIGTDLLDPTHPTKNFSIPQQKLYGIMSALAGLFSYI